MKLFGRGGCCSACSPGRSPRWPSPGSSSTPATTPRASTTAPTPTRSGCSLASPWRWSGARCSCDAATIRPAGRADPRRDRRRRARLPHPQLRPGPRLRPRPLARRLPLVALATALLLAVLAHPAARLGGFSARPALLWLGLRSYSFYLWHWPVLALTRPGLDISLPRGILIPLQLLACLALADLSYRFVELPFRGKAKLPRTARRLAARRAAGARSSPSSRSSSSSAGAGSSRRGDRPPRPPTRGRTPRRAGRFAEGRPPGPPSTATPSRRGSSPSATR